MEEIMDVILNVYKLETTTSANNSSSSSSSAQQQQQQRSSSSSWWSRVLLPAVGMGAYHTSLSVDDTTYTFAAKVGIIVQSRNSSRSSIGNPENAIFQESIPLGSCKIRKQEIPAIIKKLSDSKYFSARSYHLIHRNCNHFTETLATALIYYDELLKLGKDNYKLHTQTLSTYPRYINRLATTGGAVISQHDDDIYPCRSPWNEAAVAVGADTKIGWEFESSPSNKNKTNKNPKQQQKKKTLTEAQKKALAKIRGNK